MNFDLKDRIKLHEGFSGKPYEGTSGKLIIGYGRNIQDNGITKSEAEFMLDNDIAGARTAADSFKWFWILDKARQDVIIEMIYNMGLPTFLGFKKMIAALKKLDYSEAATQMLDSKWAKQVGNRADTLAAIMRG